MQSRSVRALSLDGITLAGDLILEIKCPYKGEASALWQSVVAGEVPEYYAYQMQHQLMVSGAKLAHLWIFDGKQGLLLEIAARTERCQEIRIAWDGFMKYLETDTAPPLSERDSRVTDTYDRFFTQFRINYCPTGLI